MLVHVSSNISHRSFLFLLLVDCESKHFYLISSALTHIDRAQSILSQFWSRHQIHWNFYLRLRHFEQRFKQIQSMFIQFNNELNQIPIVNLLYEHCQTNKSNNHLAQTFKQLDDLSQQAQVMLF